MGEFRDNKISISGFSGEQRHSTEELLSFIKARELLGSDKKANNLDELLIASIKPLIAEWSRSEIENKKTKFDFELIEKDLYEYSKKDMEKDRFLIKLIEAIPLNSIFWTGSINVNLISYKLINIIKKRMPSAYKEFRSKNIDNLISKYTNVYLSGDFDNLSTILRSKSCVATKSIPDDNHTLLHLIKSYEFEDHIKRILEVKVFISNYGVYEFVKEEIMDCLFDFYVDGRILDCDFEFCSEKASTGEFEKFDLSNIQVPESITSNFYKFLYKLSTIKDLDLKEMPLMFYNAVDPSVNTVSI